MLGVDRGMAALKNPGQYIFIAVCHCLPTRLMISRRGWPPHAAGGWPLGDDAFITKLKRQAGSPMKPRPAAAPA